MKGIVKHNSHRKIKIFNGLSGVEDDKAALGNDRLRADHGLVGMWRWWRRRRDRSDQSDANANANADSDSDSNPHPHPHTDSLSHHG